LITIARQHVSWNVGEALYLISRLDPKVQHLFGISPEIAHSRISWRVVRIAGWLKR
jgi:hypothetical protein